MSLGQRPMQNASTRAGEIIDMHYDSLRFYTLGNNYHNKVVHIGAKETRDMEGNLIL